MILSDAQKSKALEFYKRFIMMWGDKISFDTFVDQYIDICECCGEIYYYDELSEIMNWDGRVLNCCPDCRKVIKEDN